MFLLICLASGALIGMLGISYKLASLWRYDTGRFRLVLTSAAALLSLAGVLVSGERFGQAAALLAGALAGACFFLALVSVMRAMAKGPVAFSWVLINLSVLVPILAAEVLWSEGVLPRQWAGLGVFALSLLLFGKDLAGGGRLSRSWAVAATLMFFSNGGVLLFFKVADRTCGEAHIFTTLCALYLTCTALLLAGHRRPIPLKSGEAALGVTAAGCMMGGQALIMAALAVNTTAALPIIHGTSIIVVAVFSALLLDERFTKYSFAGLMAGVISIILLTLR